MLKKTFPNLNNGIYQLKMQTNWMLCSYFYLNKKGVFLSLSYLFIKFVYAAVAITQVFILNYWFRDDFYGQHSKLSFFYAEHNWKLNERFPRMTLCRFQVYVLTEQQTHVSCMINFKISLKSQAISSRHLCRSWFVNFFFQS